MGTSTSSGTSNSVTPASVPDAPTNLSATVEDSSIDLSWSAPASDGGSAITDYVVEYKLTSGGTWSVFNDGVGTTPSATVTSLSNDNSYDFAIIAKNTIGQGATSSPVSATPGPPAQVLIQSFSSKTTPTISTAVRITNEGSIAYEYQYSWCVNGSEVESCGSSDDVFDSTAAKLIQPGTNFDTMLQSTVPAIGNYWFHVTAQFGSDSSTASQSFTAVAPATDNSGGGSSGPAVGAVEVEVAGVVSCRNRPLRPHALLLAISMATAKLIRSTSRYSFHFGRHRRHSKTKVDINGDGKVDTTDFSILLYHWSK